MNKHYCIPVLVNDLYKIFMPKYARINKCVIFMSGSSQKVYQNLT